MSKAIALAEEFERMAEQRMPLSGYGVIIGLSYGAFELRRLAAIEQAALKLVKCKGRYHTEQNMIALGELLGVAMPSAICEKDDEND